MPSRRRKTRVPKPIYAKSLCSSEFDVPDSYSWPDGSSRRKTSNHPPAPSPLFFFFFLTSVISPTPTWMHQKEDRHPCSPGPLPLLALLTSLRCIRRYSSYYPEHGCTDQVNLSDISNRECMFTQIDMRSSYMRSSYGLRSSYVRHLGGTPITCRGA